MPTLCDKSLFSSLHHFSSLYWHIEVSGCDIEKGREERGSSDSQFPQKFIGTCNL
jgi:hypothetical protein